MGWILPFIILGQLRVILEIQLENTRIMTMGGESEYAAITRALLQRMCITY
jgi:hypothetical protein